MRSAGSSRFLKARYLAQRSAVTWEGVECEFLLTSSVGAGPIVEQKSRSVGREHEWDVEHLGIFQRLLHPGTDGMVRVLRFNDCDRNIGFEIEDIVGSFALAPPPLTCRAR